MRIRIPGLLVRTWDGFVAWGDVTIYRYRECELRRIDLLIAFCFVACVGYYAVTGGWPGALQGAVLWVFVAMVAILFF